MPGSQARPDVDYDLGGMGWGILGRSIAAMFDARGFDVDLVDVKPDGRVVVGFASRHALEMRLREMDR